MRSTRSWAAGAWASCTALDTHRQQIVALKTLQWVDPSSLYRFKQEFRLLADVTHPNLVNLYELVSDGRLWFFTMEFVEGLDFYTHVRGTRRVDEQPKCLEEPQQLRLRAALSQLAAAISRRCTTLADCIAISSPATSWSRFIGAVVLLDFGLSAEIGHSGMHHSTQHHLRNRNGFSLPESCSSKNRSSAIFLVSFSLQPLGFS